MAARAALAALAAPDDPVAQEALVAPEVSAELDDPVASVGLAASVELDDPAARVALAAREALGQGRADRAHLFFSSIALISFFGGSAWQRQWKPGWKKPPS